MRTSKKQNDSSPTPDSPQLLYKNLPDLGYMRIGDKSAQSNVLQE